MKGRTALQFWNRSIAQFKRTGTAASAVSQSGGPGTEKVSHNAPKTEAATSYPASISAGAPKDFLAVGVSLLKTHDQLAAFNLHELSPSATLGPSAGPWGSRALRSALEERMRLGWPQQSKRCFA
eukprot:TRINITY_DN1491_c0_g1_i1.p1 TRINITY_DN1491_c0_g1~~TRINITY_DN1491_c0_g1_i1.p1  ORF type:complete len:125 (-),score=2.48 TRINITY_DN1491_c0_g1_i1:32-406(-)